MKKKWIVAIVISTLLLLVARILYKRLGEYKNERIIYVKSLGLHFSASVDSFQMFSQTNGYVYFHCTSGELDLSTEDRAGKKLKVNRSLRFIMEDDGKPAFHSRDLDKYQLNDSLVIDSDVDRISIYRKGKLTAKSEIWKTLNGI